MYGDLIEIVGTAPLQRDQLFYGRKVDVQDIPVQSHFPYILHPELKKELWGGHLWNPSYCAVTVSDRSREQVFAYIEGQKEKSR